MAAPPIVGRVGSDHLIAHIARYVRQVEEFKAKYASKQVAPAEANLSDYTPEFSGQKKPYQPRGTVEQRCDHGAVVDQRTNITLQRLGVRWIVYEWVNEAVAFNDLDRAMDNVKQ